MATVTIVRRASPDEMAREIDRRGEVIDRLESQIVELTRDRDAWRKRESETQEALQKIGEEFGVYGGEPRTDGIWRVLTELQAENAKPRHSPLFRRALYDIIELDHHNMGPESPATKIARKALNEERDHG